MDFPPDIAFAAYTDACTFMLDKSGICRWVVATSARRAANGRANLNHVSGPLPPHAERCIGAQYVASIALGAKGGLIELPKPGAPLLFARIEPNGRIALVRTGPLVRFEEKADSGVRPAPAHDGRESRESAAPNLPDDVLDSFMAKLPTQERAGSDDDEMTTPYTPSNGVHAYARPTTPPPRHSQNARTQERESVQPTRNTSASERARGEQPRAMPRIPAPPRMPLISERVDDGFDDDPQSEGPTIPIRRSTRLPPAPAPSRGVTARPVAPLPVRASVAPPRYTPAPPPPSFSDVPTPVPHRPSAVVARRPSLVRVSAPNWHAVDAIPRTRRAR